MKLCANHSIFNFCKDNAPALKVPSGTTIEIETMDCFSNQIREPEDKLETLDWDKTNPATGPIYVEGAEVGDLLKVTIHKIVLNEKGTIVSGEGFGCLGHLLKGSHTQIIPVIDGYAEFMGNIKIPIKPMIGVIGVAPAQGSVNTGTPGVHGGNMDNTMVCAGATLYFNVELPGALFSLGDLHAVMGDGEIGVSGLEIPGNVTVTLESIPKKQVLFPMLENAESWTVIASMLTLDEAAQAATSSMFLFLKDRVQLPGPELVMLMSMVGNLEFCQVVDPLKTVRFVMPKKYLDPILQI